MGKNACRRGVYNSWEKTMIEGRKAPLAAHMFISPKGRRSISKEEKMLHRVQYECEVRPTEGVVYPVDSKPLLQL